MALPPTGMATDPGLADGAREAGVCKEMVVMMFWNGGGWPFWEVALMWVGMIAFWGLLIWAAYALIINATRRPGPWPESRKHHDVDARQILDQRLARGEIDADEDRRLRDVLASGDDRSPVGRGSWR